jgi:hypothetical protein
MSTHWPPTPEHYSNTEKKITPQSNPPSSINLTNLWHWAKQQLKSEINKYTKPKRIICASLCAAAQGHAHRLAPESLVPSGVPPRPCRMLLTVRQWRFIMPARQGRNTPTRPEWVPTCHNRSGPLASVMGWAGGAPRAPLGCVGIELVEVKVRGKL